MTSVKDISIEINRLLGAADPTLSQYFRELISINEKLHKEIIKLKTENISLSNQSREAISQLAEAKEALKNHPTLNLIFPNQDGSQEKVK